MKRAFVISAALALLVGVVFLAVTMGGGSTVRGQEEPTPTPTPTLTPLPAECDIGVVAPGIVASVSGTPVAALTMMVGDPPAVVDLTATFKNNGAVTQGAPDATCSFARAYTAEIGTGDSLTDTPVDPTKLGVRVEPYGAATHPYGDVCLQCSPAHQAEGWTAAQCLQGHGMGDYYPTPPPPWDYVLVPCDEQSWPAAYPFSMTPHSCEDGLDNTGSEEGTCDWAGFSAFCAIPTTPDATCLDVPAIGLIPAFRKVLPVDGTDTTVREVKVECRDGGTYPLVLLAGVGEASLSLAPPFYGPSSDPNAANDITATVITVTCIDSTPTPTPTPTPGPFTPTFSYTFDEVAPDDLEILPADDECPVGAPCKDLWRVEIPDGQPPAQVSGLLLPSAVVSFANGAVIPEGAILGKLLVSMKTSQTGNCATDGVITDWAMTYMNGTIDPASTTGSSSDRCSFSHWPSELNGTRDAFLAANPGAVLNSRWVGCISDLAVNTLFFAHPDGSTSYVAWSYGPSGGLCGGPEVISSVSLGISKDNPDTGQDEGGIPIRTCVAPGTHTITVALDRIDTPPGDAIVLQDTATCSPNTPAGSGVSVPLNGGTGLLGGIDFTFSEVASGGSTSVITTTTGPPPPTGFKIVGLSELPLYFDINTDASYSGELTVCIRYDESQVAGPESNLKLMQRVDGFDDITTSVDTANDIICGTTTHLSVFVVAEPLATPTPTPTPTRPHGVGGTVKLPPAAIAAESGAPAEGSGWGTASWAALAGAAVALAVGGWYARRRWLG